MELHYLEARQQRLEAIAHLGLIGCRDGAQRPSMKSVGEGYEFVLLRIAIDIMIAARRFDGAFQRLRTAICEEHGVGKRVIHQPLRKLFALGAAIRSEEHTSELQSLLRISSAVFCLKTKQQ